ncbi:DUF2971 domain-containing protein [Pectobacterium aroidearum]|uniref:DUF2971 domain-containing protein n=1 Tax=Pectobacterium aroidearum TaxID=1201031 RepID=A0ABR5ZCB5_9GAMM|nr:MULTISPECIES: DUF2971 domain-containing protein [Pectobacterium]MBA5199420.1 DUF2971 domain-containing protein [Pectobacterium aroidearum]MBA5232212.1 DUF2971 domain-containing protein [Pectobacterium aroidearum]
MDMPYTFLKFVTQDRIDILKDGFIRFTPPKELNDPFEVNPVITSIDSYNLHLSDNDRSAHIFNENDLNYSLERFIRIKDYKEKYSLFSNNYGILSLSSSTEISLMPSIAIADEDDPHRNVLMWSHYTNEHRGFIIEFYRDFMDDIDIVKVNYSTKRLVITQEEVDSETLTPFFVKGEKWCYEKEWRIIKPLKHADKTIPLNNGKNIHLFKINKSRICSITAGCNMEPEKIQELKDIVFNDPELKKCFFHISKIDNDSFSLDLRTYSKEGWTNDDILDMPSPSIYPRLITPGH